MFGAPGAGARALPGEPARSLARAGGSTFAAPEVLGMCAAQAGEAQLFAPEGSSSASRIIVRCGSSSSTGCDCRAMMRKFA